MRAVIVHALLAVFGLGFAFQTYTRKPEEETAPGSVTVVDCSPDALQRVTLRTATNEIVVEPKRENGNSTYWITNSPQASDVDKKPTETRADKPFDPHKPDAKPPEASKPKRYLASTTFAEYVKRVAPMHALRSLGQLRKEQDADFGFDKVTTHLKLQCAGRTSDFDVGARAFGASQRYVRDTKSKTTYLFDEQVVSDLESANFKFMQTDLHVFTGEDIEDLTISAQGAKKRLLHRDRKVADKQLWVDAAAPAKRNELYNNWFTRLNRLRARVYLPEGAEPGSDIKGLTGGLEPVLSIDYKIADKPNGKLEMVRADENGVGHYYVRTETTRTWVGVYDSAAKDVEQDVGMVVGTEQAPAKPDTATPNAASAKPAAPAGHGLGLPAGHPTLPVTPPVTKPH